MNCVIIDQPQGSYTYYLPNTEKIGYFGLGMEVGIMMGAVLTLFVIFLGVRLKFFPRI